MLSTHTNRGLPWNIKLRVKGEDGFMTLTATAIAPDINPARVFTRAKVATEGWKLIDLQITPAQTIPVTDFPI